VLSAAPLREIPGHRGQERARGVDHALHIGADEARRVEHVLLRVETRLMPFLDLVEDGDEGRGRQRHQHEQEDAAAESESHGCGAVSLRERRFARLS
jgi:hypothetical protein